MDTIFCPECRMDAHYTVKTEKMKTSIKGREISYIGKAAYCSNCGSEVWIPEISDANLDALYAVYGEGK